MMSVIEGGMRSAVSAEETMRPSERRFRYPAATSSGYMMRPSAATVAGADPETEPKAAQPATVV